MRPEQPRRGPLGGHQGQGEEERAEVGLVGREGITGLPIILGTDRSPNKSYVQIAGHAGRR